MVYTIPVEPSSITAEWLSDVMDADVRAVELEQIAVGVGLLGRLFRAHLQGPDVPDSVVIKMPTLDARARSALCEDLGLYLREIRFYQHIGVANPLRPATPYFAAIDEATHDFVLVLEDLARLRTVDQIVGCAAADAETVVDAIAAHHAHWWDNEELMRLSWLVSFGDPTFVAVTAANYRAAWPALLNTLDVDLTPAVRTYGERFASLIPWFLSELARPPQTFLHGDLRLDQLFFATGADDPPVTALDWQITGKGRGAYDLAYFLTQSLSIETRRACEAGLIERYAQRLAERGISYPAPQLWRDYRLTTGWCFAYPVLAAGRVDIVNDRQLALVRAMFTNAVTALGDHDAFSLRPD
ncbi:phosphotransferase [Mycobacterium sp. WMMD1722]|uniref:phosphotransferase n=1 Tax=Mycobacterium sp. WMMD1722 TaxID=3404117 RepID=UPI003BF47445